MFGNNVLGIIFAYAHEERVRDLTELRVILERLLLEFSYLCMK